MARGPSRKAARLTRKGDVLGEGQAEVRGTAEAAAAPAGDQPARGTSAEQVAANASTRAWRQPAVSSAAESEPTPSGPCVGPARR